MQTLVTFMIVAVHLIVLGFIVSAKLKEAVLEMHFKIFESSSILDVIAFVKLKVHERQK